MSYKVCIMGASFETGNRGVSALAASLIKLILTYKPEAEISLLIGNNVPKKMKISAGDRTATINVVNYRLSPKAVLGEHLLWILLLAIAWRALPVEAIRSRILRSNRWLQTVHDADFIGDIRGGDSFSDIYGTVRFIVSVIPLFCVFLLKKELVLLPQTYGPYNGFIAKQIASFIIHRSYITLTRDQEGIEVVQQLAGKGKEVKFCPDVAFTLDGVKVNDPRIEPPLSLPRNVPLIGFNINGLMYNGGYTKDNMFGLKLDYRTFVDELIKRLVKDTNAVILLIPHTFGAKGNINSDPDATELVVKSLPKDIMQNRVYRLTHEYNESEIKGIIGGCDFFIGSRMHACIAAISQEIPAIGVAYSRKFYGVFESVDIGEMIVDGRSVDTAEAVEQVVSGYWNRDVMRNKLHAATGKAKQNVMMTFQGILGSDIH